MLSLSSCTTLISLSVFHCIMSQVIKRSESNGCTAVGNMEGGPQAGGWGLGILANLFWGVCLGLSENKGESPFCVLLYFYDQIFWTWPPTIPLPPGQNCFEGGLFFVFNCMCINKCFGLNTPAPSNPPPLSPPVLLWLQIVFHHNPFNFLKGFFFDLNILLSSVSFDIRRGECKT